MHKGEGEKQLCGNASSSKFQLSSSSSSSFQLTAACSFSRQPASSPKKKRDSNQTLLTITFANGGGKKGNSERKNKLEKKIGFAHSALIATKESKAPGGSSVRSLPLRLLKVTRNEIDQIFRIGSISCLIA